MGEVLLKYGVIINHLTKKNHTFRLWNHKEVVGTKMHIILFFEAHGIQVDKKKLAITRQGEYRVLGVEAIAHQVGREL